MKRGFAAQFGEGLKFLSPQQATRGISEFLPQPTGLWYRTFALKRILYFIWIHPALQAAGNSNLNIILKLWWCQ